MVQSDQGAFYTVTFVQLKPSVTSVEDHCSFVRMRTSKAVTIRWQGSASDEAAGIPRGIEPSRNLQVETGAYVRIQKLLNMGMFSYYFFYRTFLSSLEAEKWVKFYFSM